MGSVKPTYVKALGNQLLKELGSELGGDFEENKKKVSELTNIHSKTVRNRVAGYITRKINKQKKQGGVADV